MAKAEVHVARRLALRAGHQEEVGMVEVVPAVEGLVEVERVVVE